MSDTIQQIPLEQIHPHPANRRVGGFDKGKLDQLADSIRAVGVQQPAVVRADRNLGPKGEHSYELVAGERRWRAAKLAGLSALPCVVRDLDDQTAMRIQIIENLQREDVHPLDEADGYQRLIEAGGYDVDHLAQEVGRSPSYVYQRLKLRDLVEPARKLLVDGEITAGHAILIARLGPEQQKQVLEEGLERGWGNSREVMPVRDLDDWIHERILMELSKVTWKLDDAGLLPAAGSCRDCRKRTGFQPALFADIAKKDYCTDRDCFAAKQQAVVDRRRKELEGKDHLEVIQGYYVDYTEEKKLGKQGVLEQNQWHECKKTEPGAQRILVVAGQNPGQLTWGKKEKPHRYEPSAAELKYKQETKRKHDLAANYRRSLWNEITVRLAESLQSPSPDGSIAAALPAELLRIVVLRSWDRLWDNHRVLLAKTEGWEKPTKKVGVYGNGRREDGDARIREAKDAELPLLLVKIALIGEMDVSTWGGDDKPEGLETCAKYCGIDPGALKKLAAAAVKAKSRAKTKKAPAEVSEEETQEDDE